MSLTLTYNAIDKYFGFMKYLDFESKQKMIHRLSEPTKSETKQPKAIQELFGAWDDERDSYEIISEIKEARVNKIETIVF